MRMSFSLRILGHFYAKSKVDLITMELSPFQPTLGDLREFECRSFGQCLLRC
jgi:hypothetical protein